MVEYRDLIASANPEQLEAITRLSHCIVQAGPGTGKTRTLVLKVAKLLYNDIFPPRGLACITFAKDMATKLEEDLHKLNLSNNPYIFVGTAHGFCLAHILLPFAKLFKYPIPDQITVPTGEEQVAIYDMVWKSGNFKQMALTPKDRIKKRLPIEFQKYRRTQLDGIKSPKFNSDTNKLLVEYELALIEKGFLDFDLQEKWAMQIVEQQPYVRCSLEAKFPWVLVDEYQDMGLPLHRIVRALTEDIAISVKLFAIGDSNQCIYGFRGADPKYLEELCENIELYGLPITLKQNYRFNQIVFEASKIVMPNQKIEIITENQPCGKVEVFNTTIVKKAAPIKDIKLENFLREIVTRHNIPYSEIMILAFSGETCKEISDYIRQNTGIPCFKFDKDLYEYRKPLLDWLGKLIKFSLQGRSTLELRLQEIMPFWRQLLITNGMSVYEASSYWQNRYVQTTLEESVHLKDNAYNWLEFISLRFNLEKQLEKYSHRDDIVEYKKFQKAFSPGQPLFRHSLTQLLDRIELDNRIYVGTIHSRKGQESKVVILADAQELRDSEEHKRLFYVALTRAQKEIYVLYTGKSLFATQLKSKLTAIVEMR